MDWFIYCRGEQFMPSLEGYIWCLFPSLLWNSGNSVQNNPLVRVQTVRHSNPYIILCILHSVIIGTMHIKVRCGENQQEWQFAARDSHRIVHAGGLSSTGTRHSSASADDFPASNRSHAGTHVTQHHVPRTGYTGTSDGGTDNHTGSRIYGVRCTVDSATEFRSKVRAYTE